MKAFIGLLILMAICKLPRLEMYWSDNYMIFTPNIASVMTNNWFEHFFFHQECTVDEAMIPFKGRLAFMKDKSTKWGIKVFVLADANKSNTTIVHNPTYGFPHFFRYNLVKIIRSHF